MSVPLLSSMRSREPDPSTWYAMCRPSIVVA